MIVGDTMLPDVELDAAVCRAEDCGLPVVEPGGRFGRDRWCETHLSQRMSEGRARAREEGAKPRRSRSSSSSSSSSSADRPPRGRAKPPASLEARIKGALGTLGMAVFVVNKADGSAILAGADELAAALDALARENPNVKRVLEAALQTGAWGAVLVAAAKIAIPIAANHGLLGERGAVPFGPPASSPAPPPPGSGPGYAGATGTPAHGSNGAY